METWDAVIVGAGPAGCAAAYDLATARRSVLLLDRAEFPRHKACAGGLTMRSLRALRYSVAAVTRATVSEIVVEKRHGEAATLSSRSSVCAMTVRQELDAFCLEQSVAAGAHFFRIGMIRAIEASPEDVVIRTSESSFRGRFLIGADGVSSRVRQLCFGNHGWLRRGFALEAEVQPCDGNPADLLFDLAAARHGYGWIFPKRDHLNVGQYTASGGVKLDRAGLMAYIGARFGKAQVGEVTGQFLGFGAECAPPARGRIFLVGDAGGFADPLTGEGIYGAIASGQAAAGAIEHELQGDGPAGDAFAEFTKRLRQNLLLSPCGARWFYSNPEAGFRALSAPVFRGAIISAYAHGMKMTVLANAIRRFTRAFPAGA
jgi:geranylgeranyl reductase family protein